MTVETPKQEVLLPGEHSATDIESPIWVLADHRMGNVNQCIGVAERLGLPYARKDITYTRFADLPNWLLPSSMLSVTEETRASLSAPWPELVISAGRRTAPVALSIKRFSGNATKLVHIMDPQTAHKRFDLIVMPEHDEPKPRDNALVCTGVPHTLSHRMLAEQAQDWIDPFSSLPKPHVGVIVGGHTKTGSFNIAEAKKLGRSLNEAVKELGGALLITTSPRTSRAASRALQEALDVPSHFHHWAHTGNNENPYMAILYLADMLVVSGDSMSMLSEACYTGKPLYIADEGAHISDKHRRFHQALYDRKLAQPYRGVLEATTPNARPLDATAEVVDAIRARIPDIMA